MRLVHPTVLLFGWLVSFVAAHVLVVTEARAANEPRIVLVIGNGGYAEGRLLNPAQDAVLMARTLEGVGFQVVRKALTARPGTRQQTPWESSSLVEDFYFVPGAAPTAEPVGSVGCPPGQMWDGKACTVAPRYATLIVRSSVSEDVVKIDGQPVGPSGPNPLNVLPGQHTVRVEKDGYQAHEETVTLAARAARTVRTELAREVAQARVPERQVEPGMVRVPAGMFYYGCNESVDRECYDDEKPGRRITLREFKIDKTEVTVSAYKACVLAGACKEPGNGSPCNWGKSGREAHPINCVDWHQASAYCAWAGKRLPTEQEWEKAARGTDGRIYPWGNERASCAHAVMDDGSGNGCGRGNLTWPVGSKPSGASPYGALDMAGNVWEWTSSLSGSQQPARAVVRGGPWRGNPRYVRASNRGGGNPVLGYGASGFRCAQ